ncbi:hypothetical protein CEXT_527441 [Caerostris extrusa]|uniref:Uncharacterized protein n=1 Tax=Caerostris extrusa TaxID=172846 RepID=A0AAV4RXC5_CAEEX|nr:hypothetical protein CEXT_527441 [Caerostris extrusa]
MQQSHWLLFRGKSEVTWILRNQNILYANFLLSRYAFTSISVAFIAFESQLQHASRSPPEWPEVYCADQIRVGITSKDMHDIQR